MISAVNPYPPAASYREQGNASLDYLNLALVVQISKRLHDTTQEFIFSYDPHKLYVNIQNINNKQPKVLINTYA